MGLDPELLLLKLWQGSQSLWRQHLVPASQTAHQTRGGGGEEWWGERESQRESEQERE